MLRCSLMFVLLALFASACAQELPGISSATDAAAPTPWTWFGDALLRIDHTRGIPRADSSFERSFVRGRFGNRWLALAIAVTGIVATMPYIALQLVGIQVMIGALGVSGKGLMGDLPLIIAFGILAAFTYSSGLRAPAALAIV